MKRLEGQIAQNQTNIIKRIKKKLKKKECYDTIKSKKINPKLDLSIIGKKFGKLTVIKFLYIKKSKTGDTRSFWLCKCDCGNSKRVRRNTLTAGGTKSCGCLRHQPRNRRTARYRSLIGEKFGRLSVIKEHCVKNHQVIWECECDCGNITNVSSGLLNFGSTKSCGCSKIDSQLINLSGQTFGSWKVIKRVYTKIKNNKVRGKWLCECKCGNIKQCSITELKSKKLNSCQECRDYNGSNNSNWNPDLTSRQRQFKRRNDGLSER